MNVITSRYYDLRVMAFATKAAPTQMQTLLLIHPVGNGFSHEFYDLRVITFATKVAPT